jgi:demethylspheroidene O-methyltransferase
MAASQARVAAEILDAYPFGKHKTLLDAGGGDGAFLAAAGSRYPHLRLMLFDLPGVVEKARLRLQNSGLTQRSSLHPGNFLIDPLPQGASLITLIRVILDQDDARALTVLNAVRTALDPNGTLLLAEPMAEMAGAERMGDAYFGFYLLAMGRGQPRSGQALTALLRKAGFSRIKRLRRHSAHLTGILTAQN